MEKKFTVTITGITDDSDISTVSEKFASLFRIDTNKALNIIFKKQTIKHETNEETAHKYREALEKIGVLCSIDIIGCKIKTHDQDFESNNDKSNDKQNIEIINKENLLSDSKIYDIISKYCYSKNQTFQESMNEACFSRGDYLSESIISNAIKLHSDIINRLDIDKEYKIDAKNQIRFYEDIISFQDYFHSKGATLSLNDIFHIFREIRRKINLQSTEDHEINLFNTIKSMTDNQYSENDVIKNYLIYTTQNDNPEDVKISCGFELPGLLTRFGFEHSEYTQELNDKCVQILQELTIESFESIIESSYDELGENCSSSDIDFCNNRRIVISSSTKREVWQRDQGQCSKCYSRKNLEYDHIIPVSKGGSNTARNIELLCQDCNRSKSDKIL